MTAQNQSLNTRNYQTTIIKNGVDPKYRIRHQYDETVDHLVSGCSAIVLLNIKTDMTELANTFIGRSINITKPHTIPTGMNIKLSLLLKHRAPQSLGFHNTYRWKKIDTISLSSWTSMLKWTTFQEILLPSSEHYEYWTDERKYFYVEENSR